MYFTQRKQLNMLKLGDKSEKDINNQRITFTFIGALQTGPRNQLSDQLIMFRFHGGLKTVTFALTRSSVSTAGLVLKYFIRPASPVKL